MQPQLPVSHKESVAAISQSVSVICLTWKS